MIVAWYDETKLGRGSSDGLWPRRQRPFYPTSTSRGDSWVRGCLFSYKSDHSFLSDWKLTASLGICGVRREKSDYCLVQRAQVV